MIQSSQTILWMAGEVSSPEEESSAKKGATAWKSNLQLILESS